MGKEQSFDQEANEANIKLNEQMNADSNVPFAIGGGEINSASGANIQIQEDFYGENNKHDVIPTYMNNGTPAIKISGNNK